MSTGPVSAGTRLQDAVLRPIREGYAFESTIEQLAGAIRLGVFARGDQLPPERELAERLGVSRMTLREAIGALRESGLVTTRRGRGGGTVVVYEPAQPGAAGGPVRRGADLADAADLPAGRGTGGGAGGRRSPAHRGPAGVARGLAGRGP